MLSPALRLSPKTQRSVRLVLRLAAVVGLGLGIETTILHGLTDPFGDVHAYYDAGTRLNAGLPLYDQAVGTNEAAFYRYPPLLAIVFRPLALLPFEVAVGLWMVVLVLATWLTFRRLGLREPVLLAAGWLALPGLWALTIGQAQPVVTWLLALGTPGAVALAANLKVFPALVAVYWIARRDWRSLAAFGAWLALLGVAQLAVEPAGTTAYPGFLSIEQVGDVANVSPYAVSPVLWAVLVAALLLLAIRLGPTRFGWGAAVTLSVLASPRLLVYQLSTLLAGLGGARRDGPAEPESGEGDPLAAIEPNTLRAMPHRPGLAIVLPAYNEAERIGPALDDLFGYLAGADNLPRPIEVIVVDDGSSDATAKLVQVRPEVGGALEGISLRVKTVPHGGKGAAVRAGILDTDADLIVFADADMATPPDQLPLLVAALGSHDVAVGSRIQPDGSDMRATQPWFRRILGKAFHLLASVWVVGPVQDTQCGFKGFSREAGHDLVAQQQITSIVFDVELIFLARKRGYRLAIVPIRWFDKRGSRMRATVRLGVRVAWDLFRIPLLHRSVKKVRLGTR